MKRIIKISLPVVIILILIVTLVSIKNNKQEESILTSTQNLSNKKIGWGIKRNDNHEQPDLGKTNKEILEKNEGLAIGNNVDKNVYLTFDEGYEACYTSQILATLKENNVKATFFITAHYLNTQPELVKQMIDEGHIVGNHTVNHKSMPSLTESQINSEVMDLHKAMYEKFQYEMKYIRPPMGEYSEKTLAVTNSLGYKTVMWSFAYADWNEKDQPDKEQAKKKILDNVHNGEIMLLHGNSKTNTEILGDIIKEIKNMGYEFKSLDRRNIVKKNKKNISRIDRLLEIPQEIYSNVPKITITGFNEMIIENFKGILEYEDYYIRINTSLGIINVNGYELRLENMTNDDIKVTGKIEKFDIERNFDE